jgi:phage protein D
VPGHSETARFRAPRLRAEVNGVNIDSIMHAEIMTNGSCKTSQFEITVSTIARPLTENILGSLNERVVVRIFMRVLRDESDVTMFVGLADSITIDPVKNTVRISGRDYSSALISSTYQSSFCNQTASEIANFIAMRHGLDSRITTTSALAGGYQGNDYNQILLNTHSQITNEWDLLIHLAKIEGYELFVDGSTLVFSPSSDLERNYASLDVSHVTGMKFHKNLVSSNLTSIIVKSWNSWLNHALEHTVGQSSDQVSPDGASLTSDPGAEMAIIMPNLTSMDAERIATRYGNARSEQLLTIQVTMPGELSLKPRDVLTVTGNGAVFDAQYVVRSIRRSFSPTAGFVQYIQGYATNVTSPPSVLIGGLSNG